ncbi:MAG: FtsX-like permease family protein, partial [bacterium]|nr:FtsX-like permease family protein [bacterium]
MFINYLKVAIRNITSRKLYSFINILGLSVGLAACMLIFFWIQDELSYDGFHSRGERIYRLERRWDFREMHGQAPMASGPWGNAMKMDYPEVENYVRLKKMEVPIKNRQNIFHKQELFASDNTIFEVFDYTLREGNPKEALIQPYSLVLTGKAALKYFDTQNPVGKTLTVDWNDKKCDFLVTGILDEVPAQSHLQFEMLVSITSIPVKHLSEWLGGEPLYCYVLLRGNERARELEKKFPHFLKKYMTAEFAAYFGKELDVTDVFRIMLKPVTEIHLKPARSFEVGPQGDIKSIYMFSVIAFLLLIVACINFMHLSTARAARRAREVGLRKTIGAQRRNLIGQFLGESMLMTILAMFIALIFIQLLLPVFNALSGKEIIMTVFLENGNGLKFILMGLGTSLLAGLYPALYLTAFEPAKVLKGDLHRSRGKSVFKTGMVVLQFVISISLIIGTLVIFKQMNYIRNKSLGFDKENIIVVAAKGTRVRRHLAAFRDKIKQHPRIITLSNSSNVPGDKNFSDTMFKRDDTGD